MFRVELEQMSEVEVEGGLEGNGEDSWGIQWCINLEVFVRLTGGEGTAGEVIVARACDEREGANKRNGLMSVTCRSLYGSRIIGLE